MLTRVRSTSVYARLSRRPVLLQFVRYALVGVLNLAGYLAIFNLLRIADLHPNLAVALAFLITSIQSFFLNKNWTFRDERNERLFRLYLLFVGFTIVGLGINQVAFTLFMLPLRQFGRAGENAAAIAAIPFSVMWNFVSYRRWTFRSPAQTTSSAS